MIMTWMKLASQERPINCKSHNQGRIKIWKTNYIYRGIDQVVEAADSINLYPYQLIMQTASKKITSWFLYHYKKNIFDADIMSLLMCFFIPNDDPSL